MGFQVEKSEEAAHLEGVILDALVDWSSEMQDFELLTEAAEYIMEEIRGLKMKLEDDDRTREEVRSRGSLPLTIIESHPLHGIVQQVCQEMLAIEKTEATMITSNMLDSFYAPKVDDSQAEQKAEKAERQKRGLLGECEMCERCMMLTEHHLIPRSTHSTLLQRGQFTKKEMQTRLAMLCRPCHSFVHHIPSMDLALHFNTVELLLQRPEVYKWAKYASKLKERDPAWGLARGLRNKR